MVKLGKTQVDPCTLVKIPPHTWAPEPMGWKQGSLLGRGAFGAVHMAMTEEGDLVAVKRVSLESATVSTLNPTP
ncbi:hypothetical protein T484DRAFT_1855105 [Baffinella frigidus]|nr:hypothetical protein T484DRAFT_1855105 [Cryptophyta sp. CCMP2293]